VCLLLRWCSIDITSSQDDFGDKAPIRRLNNLDFTTTLNVGCFKSILIKASPMTLANEAIVMVDGDVSILQ
jgi:hypothetical protein